jgi:hypothetical protein
MAKSILRLRHVDRKQFHNLAHRHGRVHHELVSSYSVQIAAKPSPAVTELARG